MMSPMVDGVLRAGVGAGVLEHRPRLLNRRRGAVRPPGTRPRRSDSQAVNRRGRSRETLATSRGRPGASGRLGPWSRGRLLGWRVPVSFYAISVPGCCGCSCATRRGTRSISVIPRTSCSVLALVMPLAAWSDQLHRLVRVQRGGYQPVKCQGYSGSRPKNASPDRCPRPAFRRTPRRRSVGAGKSRMTNEPIIARRVHLHGIECRPNRPPSCGKHPARTPRSGATPAQTMGSKLRMEAAPGFQADVDLVRVGQHVAEGVPPPRLAGLPGYMHTFGRSISATLPAATETSRKVLTLPPAYRAQITYRPGAR